MESQESIPDVYADAFQVTVTPFGVNMTFGLREAHPNPNQQASSEHVAVVRMSLEHTKVMAMMLTKQVKLYEREGSLTIPIPAELYQQLGIAEEDWGV